jgi:hypothetical protein
LWRLPPEPAQGARHDGRQIRGEARPPPGVEPLERDRDGEGAGLDPILEGHGPRRHPADERHDEAVERLHEGIPRREPALGRRARPRETRRVGRPVQLPDEPGRAKRERAEGGRERRGRLTTLPLRVPRAPHAIV